MKKSILIFLSAIIAVSLFVSCNGDPGTNVETKIVITFDKNGGTGVMAALSAKKGENVKLTANTFTWAEHAFKGWNTKADGTGTPYANEATVKFDSDTTLYAQWNQVVTVTFNSNDGSEITSKQVLLYNTETALNANTFSRTGYVFWGWNTVADGSGDDYADQESVTLTANLNLYAQWAIDLSTTTLSKTSWGGANGNMYFFSANTDISERITITGSVTLLLPDGMTLNAQKGITVANTNALTIDGTGTLIAIGTNKSAGVGGEYVDEKRVAGTITINGGNVTATGGHNGAGIGSAQEGTGGTITINGGNITATGTVGGAGIGGGDHGNVGKIVITGGTVNATVTTSSTYGGAGGAGIGGGYTQNGGEIEIKGGIVNATGGGHSSGPYGGAGIGGGGYEGAGGNIKISGGTVTAIGKGGGAGIGGGASGGAGGDVTITGGTVTAKGGMQGSNIGKGIGAGSQSSTNGSLTVSNLILKYSTNDSTYTAYEETDYSTRYQYMKAE